MPANIKFVADKGVEKGIVSLLRQEYEVFFVAEAMRSADDSAILEKAEFENRILLTLDKDFGELVFRAHKEHADVIRCYLQGLSTPEKASLVKATLDK